ncbi:GNAT family N-acetyltransferase [Shimia sagamensis]|uniref:Protein N-acetyltransferase, RimJ/RimL family n=1 Tax=Shimia sagamensis TaxID=1566352 RepID=A0ABY1P9I5_9RHOB|nr:GNAT family N-acetyltransferase [Shimia sagamensis]SMP27207.1 Protein N-acetyltransferase, RimJ/RimL family [Shimia sagamensis]
MSLRVNIPVIETERLRLRAPQLSDLEQMVAFYASDRSAFVGGARDEAATFTSLTSRIGHWVVREHGLWHFEEKETGTFMGWAGVINAPGWHEPELGWTVMADGEGKGYASEAAIAARTYAANHFGMPHLMSYLAPANSRSVAMAKRLGATFECEHQLHGQFCHVYRHPKVGAV